MKSPKKSDVEVQVCDNQHEALIKFNVDIRKDEDWDSNNTNEVRLIGDDNCEWSNERSTVISDEVIRITFSKIIPMSEEEIQEASFKRSNPPAEPHLENLTLSLPVKKSGFTKRYQLMRDHVFQTLRWVEIHE